MNEQQKDQALTYLNALDSMDMARQFHDTYQNNTRIFGLVAEPGDWDDLDPTFQRMMADVFSQLKARWTTANLDALKRGDLPAAGPVPGQPVSVERTTEVSSQS